MGLILIATIIMVSAVAAAADPYAVGAEIPVLALRDQHDGERRIDENTRLILVSRDMKAGNVVKAALAEAEADYLDRHRAAYIADISGMPALVSRLFALPSMRKRPYPMLLDRDGSVSEDFPAVEAKVTILTLDELRITAIEHTDAADRVKTLVEGGVAP